MRQKGFYAFDQWLDDSAKWRQSIITCETCRREYAVLYRVDRPPNCPWCVLSDRWEFVPIGGFFAKS